MSENGGQAVWGQAAETQQRSDMWHTAVAVDLRVAELSRLGPQALATGLATDDLLEGLLRQLAAAREFRLNRDSEAANRILGFRMPGDSITPGWLLHDARNHSSEVHKQGLRVRGEGRGAGPGARDLHLPGPVRQVVQLPSAVGRPA